VSLFRFLVRHTCFFVTMCLPLAAWGASFQMVTEVPAVRTAPIVFFEETSDIYGSSDTDRQRPDRLPLSAGFAFEVGVHDLPKNEVQIGFGMRMWRAHFEDPVGLEAEVWEPRVTLAVASVPRQKPFLYPYRTLGCGMMTSILKSDDLETRVNPAGHAFVGVGVMHNPKDFRFRLELRGALNLRVDHYKGSNEYSEYDPATLVTTNSKIDWRYFPGSASVSVLVGVGWGARRPTVALSSVHETPNSGGLVVDGAE